MTEVASAVEAVLLLEAHSTNFPGRIGDESRSEVIYLYFLSLFNILDGLDRSGPISAGKSGFRVADARVVHRVVHNVETLRGVSVDEIDIAILELLFEKSGILGLQEFGVPGKGRGDFLNVDVDEAEKPVQGIQGKCLFCFCCCCCFLGLERKRARSAGENITKTFFQFS